MQATVLRSPLQVLAVGFGSTLIISFLSLGLQDAGEPWTGAAAGLSLIPGAWTWRIAKAIQYPQSHRGLRFQAVLLILTGASAGLAFLAPLAWVPGVFLFVTGLVLMLMLLVGLSGYGLHRGVAGARQVQERWGLKYEQIDAASRSNPFRAEWGAYALGGALVFLGLAAKWQGVEVEAITGVGAALMIAGVVGIFKRYSETDLARKEARLLLYKAYFLTLSEAHNTETAVQLAAELSSAVHLTPLALLHSAPHEIGEQLIAGTAEPATLLNYIGLMDGVEDRDWLYHFPGPYSLGQPLGDTMLAKLEEARTSLHEQLAGLGPHRAK